MWEWRAGLSAAIAAAKIESLGATTTLVRSPLGYASTSAAPVTPLEAKAPAFVVVEVASKQFKVTTNDVIVVNKLKVRIAVLLGAARRFVRDVFARLGRAALRRPERPLTTATQALRVRPHLPLARVTVGRVPTSARRSTWTACCWPVARTSP